MSLRHAIGGVLCSAVLTPTKTSLENGAFVVEGNSRERVQPVGITKK